MATTAKEPGSTEVKVQFVGRTDDVLLPQDLAPILVPTNFRRYGLSAIVNHLVGTESTPFDFLSSGSFLRTTLDEHLTANGLSSENILTLECVRSLIPPSRVASYEHDDWVSSVDVLSSESLPTGRTIQKGEERILSGSYDGLLRVWNMSSQVLCTSTASKQRGPTSIKSARFLSDSKIVSAGLDRNIHIWDYSESRDGSRETSQLKLCATLSGHQASVDRLSLHTPSGRILSSSADHTVGLWSDSTQSQEPSKRRRLNSDQTQTSGPLSMLRGHTAPVSGAVFSPTDPTVGYSVSWDHSLRTWDLTSSVCVDTRTASHSLLALAAIPSVQLLAAGTSARHITLMDPRVSASTVSAMTLRGHSGPVVSLCTDPGSDWGIVSGSHDGTCRIWDIRATQAGESGAVGRSTYTINRDSLGKGTSSRTAGDGIKVFDVVWDSSVGVVSGGEDCRIQVNF